MKSYGRAPTCLLITRYESRFALPSRHRLTSMMQPVGGAVPSEDRHMPLEFRWG